MNSSPQDSPPDDLLDLPTLDELNSLDIPVKVISHVFSKSCNIGTEGSIHGYLCDNLDTEAPPEMQQVLLTVFLPLYEDFSFRVITPACVSQSSTGEFIQQVLEKMQDMYVEISVKERNSYEHVQ